MIFPFQLRLWIEKLLRARRYALASKPRYPAPAWIQEAASFALLDSNPVSSIAAGKVRWVERAAHATRLLSSYAWELQHAADSLEASRSCLALAKLFIAAPHPLPNVFHERLALSDASEFSVIERQRRSLSMEREALCLLTSHLRRRYGCYYLSVDDVGVDQPQPLLAGMTLLAYFVSIRRLDVVELLLDAGAQPDALCADEATALSIASRKADALSRSCPASHQAALILGRLEAASLHNELPLGHLSRPHRL